MATTTMNSSSTSPLTRPLNAPNSVIWWTIAGIVVIAAIVFFSIRNFNYGNSTVNGAAMSNAIPTTGTTSGTTPGITPSSPQNTKTAQPASGY